MGRKIKAIDATTGQPIEVDANSIKQGPIRNRSLPDSLLLRIRAIHAQISDMYSMTLEQFEVGFMRDANPEKQVAFWERLAVAHDMVLEAIPDLDRKMVLRTLLAYSMGALTPAEQADPVVKKVIGVVGGK